MKSVLHKVNKVYDEQNPSTYLKNFKNLKTFIKNRENLLLDLKLPKRVFLNANLIDYGSGMGLNTIVYSSLGSKCTLIEYDKKSVLFSKNLFKKHSKNKYKIINEDIFKFKTKKKYDIVVSNGVVHHTKDPTKNLKLCVKSLKKGGFFILGIGETNGFFQRNLQRHILYNLAGDKNELISLAKIFFQEHLKRASKYSGRSVEEIIYDTYLNPKIKTLSLGYILKFFQLNKIEKYSFYGDQKSVFNILNKNVNQFRLINKNKNKNIKYDSFSNLNLHDIENFSLSNNKFESVNNFTFNKINQMNEALNKFTDSINDIEFNRKNPKINLNRIKILRKKISLIKKIDLIDKTHNQSFLNENYNLLKLVYSNLEKKQKIFRIENYLSKCKVLLRGLNGTGMNYIVGYKKK